MTTALALFGIFGGALTVFGAFWRGGNWISRWRSTRQAGRDDRAEDEFVAEVRRISREQGLPSLCIDPEPGSESYTYCQRLVAKGKLTHGMFGFTLPESILNLESPR